MNCVVRLGFRFRSSLQEITQSIKMKAKYRDFTKGRAWAKNLAYAFRSLNFHCLIIIIMLHHTYTHTAKWQEDADLKDLRMQFSSGIAQLTLCWGFSGDEILPALAGHPGCKIAAAPWDTVLTGEEVSPCNGSGCYCYREAEGRKLSGLFLRLRLRGNIWVV